MTFIIVNSSRGGGDFGVRRLNGQVNTINCPRGVKIPIDAYALRELLSRPDVDDYEVLTHKWIKNCPWILKFLAWQKPSISTTLTVTGILLTIVGIAVAIMP
ncbi:hypothetical protein LCGC14_1457960 [marine sediment metagenome]|uniref:Uncharacterized protein n=1 Tax=marine sediment metagenome TaxID=412755 RepID=A0A0F9JGL8_9ZZZZ